MRPRTFFFCAALVTASYPARALDKQGSAHGGSIAGESSGMNVSGALMYGVSVFNPTYAARPDNTGLTLFRYAAHADIDLIGRRLSIPVDVNFFSDRERRGGLAAVPTEGDVIVGLTSTLDAWPGALEIGARVEHDRPLDRGGFSQSYADLRLRYLYSLAAVWPAFGKALGEGDLSGWLTQGVFLVNPTYAARPDNTGLALFRYGAHVELSVWHDYISFGLDATMFSDRRANDPVGPTEIDFTPEIIGRYDPFELHLAYERDMPIDRPGLVQHFAYLLAGYSFDLTSGGKTKPIETRSNIPSP